MFYTNPSVRQSYLFVSSTPLKPLQGIVYNFVVFGTSREDVPTPVNSGSLNVLKFWPYIELSNKRFVSATPLKQLQEF